MDEIERMEYYRNLRVELPVNPAWEALTQEQQDALIEGANTHYIYESDTKANLFDLEKRGYIFDRSDEFGETVYHLTYRGAMIIPPQLVKKETA